MADEHRSVNYRSARNRRPRIAVAAALLLAASCAVPVAQVPPEPPLEAAGPPVEIARYSPAGQPLETVAVPKIIKNETAWRESLTDHQFAVTREGATEPAFSGTYDKFDQEGLYRCVACGEALFSSDTKFDSKSGWPSFWAPIAKPNLYSRLDTSWGMRRREVLCSRCDSHLGHVFKDGPKPTYLRYCVNSAALRFEPLSEDPAR